LGDADFATGGFGSAAVSWPSRVSLLMPAFEQARWKPAVVASSWCKRANPQNLDCRLPAFLLISARSPRRDEGSTFPAWL